MPPFPWGLGITVPVLAVDCAGKEFISCSELEVSLNHKVQWRRDALCLLRCGWQAVSCPQSYWGELFLIELLLYLPLVEGTGLCIHLQNGWLWFKDARLTGVPISPVLRFLLVLVCSFFVGVSFFFCSDDFSETKNKNKSKKKTQHLEVEESNTKHSLSFHLLYPDPQTTLSFLFCPLELLELSHFVCSGLLWYAEAK